MIFFVGCALFKASQHYQISTEHNFIFMLSNTWCIKLSAHEVCNVTYRSIIPPKKIISFTVILFRYLDAAVTDGFIFLSTMSTINLDCIWFPCDDNDDDDSQYFFCSNFNNNIMWRKTSVWIATHEQTQPLFLPIKFQLYEICVRKRLKQNFSYWKFVLVPSEVKACFIFL